MTCYTTISRMGDGRDDKDNARRAALARLLPLFGARPDERVAHDEAGRPFLPDRPAIEISISHAAPFTAVAVSTNRVGVDVECVESIRDPAGLARRFFTDGEQRMLAEAPHLAAAVCEIWTRKESLAKYVGTGLAATMGLCTETPPAEAAFYTKQFSASGKRYTLTLCATEPPREIKDVEK